MFSLEPLFRLEAVQARIQQFFDAAASCDDSDNIRCISNLRIVGYERPCLLLVAWDHVVAGDDDEECTFIGYYTLDSNAGFSVLHRLDVRSDVVAASVNAFRNLVAFTVAASVDGVLMYEARIAEIMSPFRIFSLGSPSGVACRVQFFDLPVVPASDTKSCGLVFILGNTHIHQYALQVDTHNKLSEQPRRERVIHKQHSWFHWDVMTQSLFVIAPKSSLHGSFDTDSMHIYQVGVEYVASSGTGESVFHLHESYNDYSPLWTGCELALPKEMQGLEFSDLDPRLDVSTDISLEVIRSSTTVKDSLVIVLRRFMEGFVKIVVTTYCSYRILDRDYSASYGLAFSSGLLSVKNSLQMCSVAELTYPGSSVWSSLLFLCAKQLVLYVPQFGLHMLDCFDDHETSWGLALGASALQKLNIDAELASLCSGRIAEFPLLQQDRLTLSFAGSLLHVKSGVVYCIKTDVKASSIPLILDTISQMQMNAWAHFLVSHLELQSESLEIKEFIRYIVNGGKLPQSGVVYDELVIAFCYRFMCDNDRLKGLFAHCIPYTSDRKEHEQDKIFQSLLSHRIFDGVFRKAGNVVLRAQNSALCSCSLSLNSLVRSIAINSTPFPLSDGKVSALRRTASFIGVDYDHLANPVLKAADTGSRFYQNRWNGLLSRLFGPAQIFGDGSAARDVQSLNLQSSDVFANIRTKIVDNLTEEMYQSSLNADGNSTALGTSPSSSSLSKSFKTSFVPATMQSRDDLRRESARHATKYAQLQVYFSSIVWSVLNDSLPSTSQLQNCDCTHCVGSKNRDLNALLQPPFPSPRLASSPGNSRRASGILLSQMKNASRYAGRRFDFVSSVILANSASYDRGTPLTQSPFVTEMVTNKEIRRLFQAVLHFYSSLERLALPVPVGFQTKLAIMAFHCVSVPVLFQYIDRGIIQVTESFLKHALDTLRPQSGEKIDNLRGGLISRHESRKKIYRNLNADQDWHSDSAYVKGIFAQCYDASENEGRETNNAGRWQRDRTDSIASSLGDQVLGDVFFGTLPIEVPGLKEPLRNDGSIEKRLSGFSFSKSFASSDNSNDDLFTQSFEPASFTRNTVEAEPSNSNRVDFLPAASAIAFLEASTSSGVRDLDVVKKHLEKVVSLYS